MKAQDTYLMFVRWSDDDQLYVGYCPDLFPAGGVCHGATSLEAYAKLYETVEDAVKTAEQQGLPLPAPKTRPMREIEALGPFVPE
jgi:predicted RNase H-like HicB family nuclease